MSDIRKPLPPVLDVRVTFNGGTYQTQTVRGQRASCTSGPRRAVVALSHKLWTDRPVHVRELPAKGLRAGQSLWRLAPTQSSVQATVTGRAAPNNGASRGEVHLPPRDAAVAASYPPASAPAGGDVRSEA